MAILNAYLRTIEIPFKFAMDLLELQPGQGWYWLYYIVATLFLFLAIERSFRSVKRFFKKDSLADTAAVDALVTKNNEFVQGLRAVSNLEGTIAPLKKAKDYAGLAKVYASLNKHKDAAKWYKKAGDRKEAAVQMARAGKTVKAAKLLLKEGDYSTAGRFFSEKGRHVAAAKAFQKSGELAQAAEAFGRAKRFNEACQAYADYFAEPRDPLEIQVATADSCMGMLQSEAGNAKIPAELRQELLPHLARRFEQSKRYETAAKIYRESGELARAGEVYVLANKLEEAATCMREAGKEKEAAQIVGRYYENKKMWREAAQSHTAAGDFLRAGECYTQAKEALPAAQCFEKAGEHYRAGLAYARSVRYEDAIRTLQKIKEEDTNFDQSRAILGRCFYELHDYAHCAAALDNHLIGKRVDSHNVDYFYMLALAYEQMGKLDESREILQKVRTVNMDYKDVATRISNISSRISISQEQAGGTPPIVTPSYQGASDAQATAVMQTVETSLGQRYHLERELGRGGMGVVYLAKDTQLDRPVALKFLGSLVDNSEEYRQRFVREAKAAAKINHPNIISIYDISASLGKAYIAMEYVEGPNLFRYVTDKKEKRLSPREAVNIILQTCAALAAIHEVGVVHRDLKPDNILIAKGGLVKLTDFGLAKAKDMRITQAGTVLGTPSYMSPEQAMGNETDARSDIYSLGLVFHEALTGKVVFLEGDAMQRQIHEVPPSPAQTVDGISEDLDNLVMKCIAKKPEERYQSAKELGQALRKLKD